MADPNQNNFWSFLPWNKTNKQIVTNGTNQAGQNPNRNSPVFYISPVQFERIKQDIQTWREAIQEAENAWTPHRVRMQRIYQDTILNEHIEACWSRRKDLTLLRDFKICDAKGNENLDLKKIFDKTWFYQFLSLTMDALAYGYNLISLGDLINDEYPNLSFIRRQNISPDRLVVNTYVYSLSGQRFDAEPFSDWHIYVKTPSENGVSPCGWGFLYKVAKTEIYLRNNIGQNADFNEMWPQPIRVGSTTKQGAERDMYEAMLRNMGSSAYILKDIGQDELELVESKNSGSAYQTYDNFEKRLEQKISKVILGHADAIDSVPGKLGGGSGEESPASEALKDKQTSDAKFIIPVINEQLIPRMRKHGFLIPEGFHFEFVNDDEKEEFRRREDDSNKKTADLFKTIVDAGGEPDWKYFTERTGINVTKKENPVPQPTLPKSDLLQVPLKNKLK